MSNEMSPILVTRFLCNESKNVCQKAVVSPTKNSDKRRKRERRKKERQLQKLLRYTQMKEENETNERNENSH